MSKIGDKTFANDREYIEIFSGRRIDKEANSYVKERVLKSIIDTVILFNNNSKVIDNSQKILSAVVYAYSGSKAAFLKKNNTGDQNYKLTDITFNTNLDSTVKSDNRPIMNANKQGKVTFENNTYSFDTIAKYIQYSLIANGIYIEIPSHALAVKRIMTILTLFNYRMKSTFYQDKGKETMKNDGKNNQGLIRYRQYGLTKEYYNHYKYMNLPPETKSTIRGATGIGTDMIDYYEMAKRNYAFPSDKFEKPKIENFFRRKLVALGADVSKAILEEIERVAKSKAEPGKIIETTMAVATIVGVKYDNYFVMPLQAYVGMELSKIDFSAQGAYNAYLRFKSKCDSGELLTMQHCNNIEYAMLISMFDLVLADQGLVQFMFGIPAMRRGELGRQLLKTTYAHDLNFPILKKWSKAYRGEKGDAQKNEQKAVNVVMAGKQNYTKYDFLCKSTVKTRILDVYDTLAGIMLNAEHRNISPTITFGTQFFHDYSDLEKIGTIEGGEEYTTNKVIPFFTGTSEDTIDPEKIYSKVEKVKRNTGDISSKMDVDNNEEPFYLSKRMKINA